MPGCHCPEANLKKAIFNEKKLFSGFLVKLSQNDLFLDVSLYPLLQLSKHSSILSYRCLLFFLHRLLQVIPFTWYQAYYGQIQLVDILRTLNQNKPEFNLDSHCYLKCQPYVHIYYFLNLPTLFFSLLGWHSTSSLYTGS